MNELEGLLSAQRERERESTGGGTKIGEKVGFFFKITSIFKQFC